MFFSLLSEIESVSGKLDFTVLYLTYRSLMYRVALKILNNHADAEDAVAAAFKNAFIHQRQITKIVCSETKSLLVIIVRNKAIDIYRRKRHEIPMGDSIEGLMDDVNVDELFPFEMPGDNGLADAIAKLPKLERDIVLLHVDNGLKYREIAEIVGLSAEAVRKRYTRALEQLKKELNDQE